MEFSSSLAIGLLVFFAMLILKRFRFHYEPTPLFVLGVATLLLTFNHIVLKGLIKNNWSAALMEVAFIYVAMVCYMIVVGDARFYWDRYKASTQRTEPPLANEDDPNWSDYRPS